MAPVTKEQLKEYVMSNPEHFNMHVYYSGGQWCLAGLAAWLADNNAPLNLWDYDCIEAASIALGIDTRNASDLFFIHCWPMSLHIMYRDATDAQGRAEAGCLAIDAYWERYHGNQ